MTCHHRPRSLVLPVDRTALRFRGSGLCIAGAVEIVALALAFVCIPGTATTAAMSLDLRSCADPARHRMATECNQRSAVRPNRCVAAAASLRGFLRTAPSAEVEVAQSPLQEHSRGATRAGCLEPDHTSTQARSTLPPPQRARLLFCSRKLDHEDPDDGSTGRTTSGRGPTAPRSTNCGFQLGVSSECTSRESSDSLLFVCACAPCRRAVRSLRWLQPLAIGDQHKQRAPTG